jgi:phosphoribosylamine---glycine ligase
MRILGVTETCDLGALYTRLTAEGHDVRISISHPLAQGTLAGLVSRTADWRAELPWVKAAGREGMIVFESVSEGFGALQDDLRRQGYNVVGGSAFGDRLENDRRFAQDVLEGLGLSVAPVRDFARAQEALAFIEAHPGRYVLKRSGAGHSASDTYVGRLEDGRDVAAMLRTQAAGRTDPIVLMDFIDGVEMGTGAYFDGRRFIRPACLDWEHKRFFPGDQGEMTGEMGTVVTYDGTDAFFEATLARLEPMLAEHGHVGYVNLNTMVNEAGVWPLEFTCRFGYPGYAVLTPLQETPWGDLLKAMVNAGMERMQTRSGFCVGVVRTTPPFPYSREEVDEPVGLPLLIEPGAREHVHLCEVGLDASGALITSGLYGWTAVVTGIGDSIARARAEAYDHIDLVFTPNARFRRDIGERLDAVDYERVAAWGNVLPRS